MKAASNKGKVERVLLTVHEACDSLAVGRTTLYGLIQAGQIATVRIGKRGIRVPKTEIERFANQGGADDR